ncbi:hypothetical protein D3C71_1607070 [compost metagenome]
MLHEQERRGDAIDPDHLPGGKADLIKHLLDLAQILSVSFCYLRFHLFDPDRIAFSLGLVQRLAQRLVRIDQFAQEPANVRSDIDCRWL